MKKYTLKKYTCYYCGHKFEKEVIYEAGEKYSTQVKCPKCYNFIPTWKREETGNIVGRKHIHIRD